MNTHIRRAWAGLSLALTVVAGYSMAQSVDLGKSTIAFGFAGERAR
jgi:hypothetical protein